MTLIITLPIYGRILLPSQVRVRAMMRYRPQKALPGQLTPKGPPRGGGANIPTQNGQALRNQNYGPVPQQQGFQSPQPWYSHERNSNYVYPQGQGNWQQG